MSITIEKYIKLNRQQRQAHIDLTSPCIPAMYKNKNAYASNRMGRIYAARSILKELNISGKTTNFIHACHLCKNSSAAPNGFVCVNPEHIYIGTASENHHDIPAKKRKAFAKAGNKVSNLKPENIEAKRKRGREWAATITPEIRLKAVQAATKSAIANGNHTSQQTKTCIYCGHENNPGVIALYHNERCKNKP